jgi:threonine aldolase
MDMIDLRSDTVTRPTASMRKAMAEAPVGDDGYGDDPTLRELEALSASLLGKEASLFVPSGSFGNELAVFTHCGRGDEVILTEDCHIVQHEAGAAAVIAGVQLRTVASEEDSIPADAVLDRLRDPSDYHAPHTGLVCLENATSRGRAASLKAMDGPSSAARSSGVPVHLDGARIFNAAIALGVSPAAIAERADSVMFCLSKGLAAPVGSMLAGKSDFIAAARKKRKIMGGQLRQGGILAAACLVALREELPRLGEDHETARMLARSIASIPSIDVDLESVHINMVFFRHLAAAKPGSPDPDGRAVVEELRKRGVLVNPPHQGVWRIVAHRDVPSSRVGEIALAFREAFQGA